MTGEPSGDAEGVLYTCPVCISAFRLERSAEEPVPGILTCPVCGCATVRVSRHERQLIEAAYNLQTCVRDILADRAKEPGANRTV